MGTQQRRTASTLGGFFLIAIGFLLFLVAYFLLPLYVTTVNCFDSCTPPIRRTTWESSLQIASHLANTPFGDAFALALHYLPLLAALLVFGYSIGFLLQPQRFFVKWFYRSWLTGIITLIVALPFLFFFIQPEIGYLGMLVGYGLFFCGYRLFFASYTMSGETRY